MRFTHAAGVYLLNMLEAHVRNKITNPSEKDLLLRAIIRRNIVFIHETQSEGCRVFVVQIGGIMYYLYTRPIGELQTEIIALTLVKDPIAISAYVEMALDEQAISWQKL